MDLKKLVGTVAPWIGTALGGPLGGVAVKAIGKAIGLDEATEQSLAKVFSSGVSPEQLLAVKQADQEFAARMQELGFSHVEKLEEFAAADRASARGREIAVKDWTPRILAYTIMGGFVTMAFTVLFHKLSAETALAGAVIGYLSAKAELVASYYFGSSSGSDRKTELLAQGATWPNGAKAGGQ